MLNLNLAWEAIPDKLTFKAGTSFKKYTFQSYESRRAVENMYAPPANLTLASLSTMVSGLARVRPAGRHDHVLGHPRPERHRLGL